MQLLRVLRTEQILPTIESNNEKAEKKENGGI